MNNDPNNPQPETQPANAGSGDTPSTATAPEAGVAPPARDEAAAQLAAEVAELKDRLLRAHAEMDNVRKRLEREKADAHKFAISKFARDIVNVGDNFLRAIASVPPAAVDQAPALKSFLDGVVMTERELLNVLERHGIRRVDPMGEPFNPHLHQAVSEMQNPDVPSGTVIQVFQPGYTIEDRILRPAMVVVAKGGAKASRAGEGAPGSAANDDQPGTPTQ
jgi:molecular chaperone GrpE